MNLFIVSSSRITRSIVYKIDYVLNADIDKVYVLKENHSQDDFFHTNNKVILCENISEALLLSDTVIIVDNKKIPNRVLDYVRYSSKHRVILIDGITDNTEESYLINETDSVNSIPKILNISIGDIVLSYCIEIYLNSFFNDNNVRFCQSCSRNTNKILDKFRTEKLINPRIISSLAIDNSKIKDYELYIKTVFFPDINVMIQSFHRIELFKPDYIVLNVVARISEQYDLETLFRYRLGCNTFVIRSHYLDIKKDENNNRLVLCPSLNGSYYFGSNEFDINFERSLKRALSFPNNIQII